MPKCIKCGCNWISRNASPVACPNCKSRNWAGNVVAEVLRVPRSCVKCGNKWLSHGGKNPQQCPLCKSKAWDGLHDYRGRLIGGGAVVVPSATAAAPVPCWFCGGVGCARCNTVAVVPVADCPRCHGIEGGCGVCGGVVRCGVCSDSGNGPDGRCPACGLSPVEVLS